MHLTLTGDLFCAQNCASFQAWEAGRGAETGEVSVFKNTVNKTKQNQMLTTTKTQWLS